MAQPSSTAFLTLNLVASPYKMDGTLCRSKKDEKCRFKATRPTQDFIRLDARSLPYYGRGGTGISRS